MPPAGLAILLGAGPNAGTGIARMLAHPQHGNLAIALLSRTQENLTSVKATLQSSLPTGQNSHIETFTTDTSPDSLARTFQEISTHPSFQGLKLRIAVFNVKHSSKKDFLKEETYADFVASLSEYVGGAFSFAQESLKRFFADHGDGDLKSSASSSSSSGGSGGSGKKGTLIFTGTTAAVKTSSASYAAYAGGRAAVRMMAMGLAKDYSKFGVHVVHAVANGRIEDVRMGEGEESGRQGSEAVKAGERISADAVGREYCHLMEQEPTLWTWELDLRNAMEGF